MSSAIEEAIQNRYAKYAVKFANDAPGMMPTDARLAEVLANCARPPKPEEFPAIRQLLNTYLDGRESKGRDARAALLERAEAYASKARQFTGPEHGSDGEARWYIAYNRDMAGELRKVAASL
jgi:hypothetical protein